MTEKEKIEQLTEALLRYVAVCGKTQLRADGLYTTAELMSRFGIVALPENAVVLTREEWRDLHKSYGGMLYKLRQEAGKDTAQEFAEKLKYTLTINNEENTEYFDYQYTLETIDEIAKQFGVEVDE